MFRQQAQDLLPIPASICGLQGLAERLALRGVTTGADAGQTIFHRPAKRLVIPLDRPSVFGRIRGG
jgi:hypothetical protein